MNLENLTNCEEMVMKTVWDAEQELDLAGITQRVNETYHKDWKPQTVSTFLGRLVRKGYLKHYRHGRVFYYQILVLQKDYLGELAERFAEFWKQENVDVFLAALKKQMPHGDINL
ncbi:MAG: BlaI/MecI/CopY family transcriptional regulator [Lachnospiraceae bacterium]|nr:BlaI/MecI/CopY family transcriptional regulator [Lachnospiraceae bacterium]